MRKSLFFLLWSLISSSLIAQIIPIQNAAEELTSHRVRVLSTYYIATQGDAERLIFQKEFNAKGKIIKQYQLSLWEAISNSHTTSYIYNNDGYLIEEIKIQEYLNLYKRDDDYLQIFGNKPLNQKIKYEYNEKNQRISKSIFSFGEIEKDKHTTPDQRITYHYENGILIAEESSSEDKKFFNKNYKTEISYDSSGNVIRKITRYGEEENMIRKYIYQYDSLGRLIQDQVLDSAIPHNNKRLKYEYNSNGQLVHKYLFDDIEQAYEIETTYQYDERGNIISGEREVNFEYYENGLIKSENWKDPVSDEAFNFITRYQFY